MKYILIWIGELTTIIYLFLFLFKFYYFCIVLTSQLSLRQDSKFKIQDSRLKIRDSRFKIQDSRFKIFAVNLPGSIFQSTAYIKCSVIS